MILNLDKIFPTISLRKVIKRNSLKRVRDANRLTINVYQLPNELMFTPNLQT